MNKLKSLTFSFLMHCTCCIAAQHMYQIDLLIFTVPQTSTVNYKNINQQNFTTPHNGLGNTKLITLSEQNAKLTPYHLLPTKFSAIKNEYRVLSHKPDYQILINYTWLQPTNNQKSINIVTNNVLGWNINGSLRIRRSKYYSFDTNLYLQNYNSGLTFKLEKKQRLKPGIAYYLDHPYAGIIIKIHQIA